ncbi:hypothetical protein CY35_07G086300 [Sphagnum magellanicum]|uniref:Uncharacterized protein n=1 Tax=Sphagnum magellanicum TaxID=128215 RepID=A0ACB8HMR8_9BRYO|nr:hypothetical protein CY35_07G086300 [Sphagnum magellanicum]
MEGSWSHSVRGWSNSSLMGGPDSSCSMSSLFFGQDSILPAGDSCCKPKSCAYGAGRFQRPDQVLLGGGGFELAMSKADQCQQLETTTSRARRGLILDSLLLRSSCSSSMVDSSSEIVTAADDQDIGLTCSASSEQINMRRNHLMMPAHASSGTAASCLQQQLRSDSSSSGARLQFCCIESPAGPLSRGESEEESQLQGSEPSFFNANSVSACGELQGSFMTMGLKKETWMDLRLHEEKPFVFQEHSPAYAGAVPSSLEAGGSYLNPQAPGHAAITPTAAILPGFAATQSAPLPSSFAAAPGAVLSHEVELLQGESRIHNLRDKMASSMRAILFRASLPMPTAAEIENSRPKRRNVRISKDPQSVAARHRRERISDRIRVLQRLVPGGTKMDTASMLDEAIHYVKFLKLQLQTLEQLGNHDGSMCDPATILYNGELAMGVESPNTLAAAAAAAAPMRAFDLNCTVHNQFNSSRETAAVVAAAGGAAPGSVIGTAGSLSSGESLDASCISSGVRWPTALSSVSNLVPFGGTSGGGQFPDPLQEQFCH